MTRIRQTRVLHVVALPHTTLTERAITCAYSMKVLKFCKMMRAQGCWVVLYGPDESDAECDEHVVITTEYDRARWGFGDGFDTALTPFLWNASMPYWSEPNDRVIGELRARIAPHHYLCLITGWPHQPVAAVVSPSGRGPIVVEWGVGYEGFFSEFCAFESYAWMHHVYGLHRIVDGRPYDAVIPNFFDADDFVDPARWLGAPKADYLLYVGRLMHRKGPQVAAMIAERAGVPLLVAGPGATEWREGRIVAPDVTLEGDVKYVGVVGFKERARLMARASAVMVPTLYVEPFGGVAVEAMMSGTPVIASDWGSFPEIVTPRTGALFRTLRQGADAVGYVRDLDPAEIRRYAIDRYGLDAVGARFTEWFDQLDTLWEKGWHA